MNVVATSPIQTMSFQTGTSGAVVSSLAIHAVIIVLMVVGLPMVAKDPIMVPPPITVDIVDIDQITQSTSKRDPAPRREAPPKPTPPQSKPKPPKVTASKAPDMAKPKPPKVTEKVAERREAAPVPKLERKDIKKPEPAPKPEPKEVEPPKPTAAEQAQRFDSLLKNLAPDTSEERQEANSNDKQISEEPEISTPRIGERITISEQDALRRQLSQCWNVLSGAKYAEDLAVEVRVMVNPDRTVQQATVLDQSRYGRDPHFRAAADAALRALRNPRCTPLDLPADKYESWKTTVINFNPRDML